MYTPNWERIELGYDWVAVDSDGDSFAYNSEPCLDEESGYWDCDLSYKFLGETDLSNFTGEFIKRPVEWLSKENLKPGDKVRVKDFDFASTYVSRFGEYGYFYPHNEETAWIATARDGGEERDPYTNGLFLNFNRFEKVEEETVEETSEETVEEAVEEMLFNKGDRVRVEVCCSDYCQYSTGKEWAEIYISLFGEYGYIHDVDSRDEMCAVTVNPNLEGAHFDPQVNGLWLKSDSLFPADDSSEDKTVMKSPELISIAREKAQEAYDSAIARLDILTVEVNDTEKAIDELVEEIATLDIASELIEKYTK